MAKKKPINERCPFKDECDRKKCDFQFPGIFRQEDMVVGIMSNDPKKARKAFVAVEEAMAQYSDETSK